MTVFAFFCIITFFRDSLSNLSNYLPRVFFSGGEDEPTNTPYCLTVFPGSKKNCLFKVSG